MCSVTNASDRNIYEHNTVTIAYSDYWSYELFMRTKIRYEYDLNLTIFLLIRIIYPLRKIQMRLENSDKSRGNLIFWQENSCLIKNDDQVFIAYLIYKNSNKRQPVSR